MMMRCDAGETTSREGDNTRDNGGEGGGLLDLQVKKKRIGGFGE